MIDRSLPGALTLSLVPGPLLLPLELGELDDIRPQRGRHEGGCHYYAVLTLTNIADRKMIAFFVEWDISLNVKLISIVRNYLNSADLINVRAFGKVDRYND